jgi:hypothetical protein
VEQAFFMYRGRLAVSCPDMLVKGDYRAFLAWQTSVLVFFSVEVIIT